MRKLIITLVNRLGYDITRKRPDFALYQHLRRLGIRTVLDVGANYGQYGQEIRRADFQGTIFSFEPIRRCFLELEKRARADGRWFAHNCALGSSADRRDINISEADAYSSFRRISDDHVARHPWAKITRTETVTVVRLDGIFNDLIKEPKGVMLKIDVQGYENEVLAGASGVIDKIDAIQIEMSIDPSYSDQEVMCEQIERLAGLGYSLVDIVPGARDIDGHLYEIDGFFVRKFAGRPL